MHVVGEDDPRVDKERITETHPPNRVLESIDVCHEQLRSAIEQVHSKEVGSTRNPIAAIVRHKPIMLALG